MIGLLDPEREQVVFAGFVRGINRGSGPDNRDRDIASGVARVLAHYPGSPAPPRDGRAGNGDAGATSRGRTSIDAGGSLPVMP